MSKSSYASKSYVNILSVVIVIIVIIIAVIFVIIFDPTLRNQIIQAILPGSINITVPIPITVFSDQITASYGTSDQPGSIPVFISTFKSGPVVIIQIANASHIISGTQSDLRIYDETGVHEFKLPVVYRPVTTIEQTFMTSGVGGVFFFALMEIKTSGELRISSIKGDDWSGGKLVAIVDPTESKSFVYLTNPNVGVNGKIDPRI